MTEIVITEESIRSSKKNALGTQIFELQNSINGIPTLFLNTAIPMSIDEFRENYECVNGNRGFYYYKDFYNLLNAHTRNRFFTFDKAMPVESYAVYSFYTSRKWVSLSQLDQPVSSELALSIFRKLILFLEEYSRSPINANGYKPLLFICRDSVYVELNSDYTLNDICILPLPYSNTTEYIGMPRDIHNGKADITADIYMAAYLYLELKYSGNEPFNEDEYSEYDQLAERCLSLFAQRRPSLNELFEALKLYADETVNPQEEINDEGWQVYPSENISDNEESETPVKRIKIDPFKKLFPKKKRNDINIKETFTDVRDKFDSVLSTEQGDQNDDN